MRKVLAMLVALTLVAASTGAMAGHHKGHKGKDGYCPVKVLNHAKELKLSSKQKRDLGKIKSGTMKDMDALKAKTSKAVADVLSDDQEARYAALEHKDCGCGAKGKHGKGHHRHKDGKKDSCQVR